MVKAVLNILLLTKMMEKLDLCIMFPQMSAYRKDFDEFNYVFFDKRLEKYNRRQKHIKKGFDSELYKMKNI